MMILNIQSIIEYHNQSNVMLQNEQILDEDNNLTPDKNEFSSVDSRVTVIRYPSPHHPTHDQFIDDMCLLDEDSPFKLKLFPVQIFDRQAFASRSVDSKCSSHSDYEEEKQDTVLDINQISLETPIHLSKKGSIRPIQQKPKKVDMAMIESIKNRRLKQLQSSEQQERQTNNACEMLI